MPPTSRYFSLPVSFFTSPPTAGLTPLAACLYLRARASSLIGALQLSPRVLALGHASTPDDVLAAIGELEARGLARWWDAHEVLVVTDALHDARGSAIVAAMRQVEALPPGPLEFCRDLLGVVGWGATGVREGVRGGAAMQLGLVGTPPDPTENREQKTENRSKKAVDPAAAPVLEHLDALRVGLGLRRLPPSQRTDRLILARLAEGVTVDEMCLALTLRARECAKDPAGCRYFDATSPFTGPSARGPGGWAVSARMIDEADRRSPPPRGPGGAMLRAPDAAAADYAARVEQERQADAKLREGAVVVTMARRAGGDT